MRKRRNARTKSEVEMTKSQTPEWNPPGIVGDIVDERIVMGHGAGGRKMHRLISKVFLKHFASPALRKLADSAVLGRLPGTLAMTTDSYVVQPLFFPGGDIGKLAVCGTVNDLAVMGAAPRYMSLAFVIREGLEVLKLEAICRSIGAACRKARAPRLRGFATLNPAEPGSADRLREFVAAGLVGAKVHPPVQKIALDDPALDPFWTAAEELGIPIHLHTGSHGGLLKTYRPMLLDEVAQAHPNLPLIIDHMGGYALFDEALAVLHNNRNAYAGFTQASGRYNVYEIPPHRVKVVLDTVGADRVVHGLDYPWNADNDLALGEDIAWVRAFALSREDTDKILGGNILRLTARG